MLESRSSFGKMFELQGVIMSNPMLSWWKRHYTPFQPGSHLCLPTKKDDWVISQLSPHHTHTHSAANTSHPTQFQPPRKRMLQLTEEDTPLLLSSASTFHWMMHNQCALCIAQSMCTRVQFYVLFAPKAPEGFQCIVCKNCL